MKKYKLIILLIFSFLFISSVSAKTTVNRIEMESNEKLISTFTYNNINSFMVNFDWGNYQLQMNEDPTPNNTEDELTLENICQDKGVRKSLSFLGNLLKIVKIVVPILLIIMGTIDFFKAVLSSSSDVIKKSTTNFIFRIIAGVCIFFLPTIIYFVFNLIPTFGSKYEDCKICIFTPEDCKA